MMGLEALFSPQAVAVVGASNRELTIGYRIVQNLREFGYTGPVYPVNPKGCEIRGLPSFPLILETLVAATKNRRKQVRARAVSAFGAFGPLAAKAAPALIEALKDDDTDVRENAALALIKVGHRVPVESIPILTNALQIYPCELAAEELGRFGPAAKDAVPALEKVRDDPDKLTDCRKAAKEALEKILGE